jgi:hypothetical protein
MAIKREIIEEIIKEICKEKPYLNVDENLYEIIEIAYKKGYERAIEIYGDNK